MQITRAMVATQWFSVYLSFKYTETNTLKRSRPPCLNSLTSLCICLILLSLRYHRDWAHELWSQTAWVWILFCNYLCGPMQGIQLFWVPETRDVKEGITRVMMIEMWRFLSSCHSNLGRRNLFPSLTVIWSLYPHQYRTTYIPYSTGSPLE